MTIDAEPLPLTPLTETLLQTVFKQQIRIAARQSKPQSSDNQRHTH